MKINKKYVVLILILIFTIQTIYPLSEYELLDIHVNSSDTRISRLGSPNSFKISKINDNGDIITIELLSPQNNSIVKGGTSINLEFLDVNGTVISPVTELYRWDFGSNFESILRPLPMQDGAHTLEVQIESLSGVWSEKQFTFISDNKPHEIALHSPVNSTYQLGGSNIKIWESSFANGSLSELDYGIINADSIPDIIAGGPGGRVYGFNGQTGTAILQTPLLGSQVNGVEVFNETSLLIGLQSGDIRCLNLTNNQFVWNNYTISTEVKDIIEDNYQNRLFILHSDILRSFNYNGIEQWNYSFNDNTGSFISTTNIFGNSLNEIITVNGSGFIRVQNSTNGNLLFNFTSINNNIENILIDADLIYLTYDNGFIRSYNLTTGDLEWENLLVDGPNIYDIVLYSSNLYCSSAAGHLFKVNSNDGNVIWSKYVSTSFIKYLYINDFDNDNKEEILLFDGINTIRNLNANSGSSNWNFTSPYQFTNFLFVDITNDSRLDSIATSITGEVYSFNPQGLVPLLVPCWSNVSISFNDEISQNYTKWEKYSWDGNTNVTTLGTLPNNSGIHSLNVYVSDFANNIAHAYYEFYTAIEIKLNSPANNSFQQSGTIINLTFSESPKQVEYKWDGSSYQAILSSLPTGQSSHHLFVKTKDQSNNSRIFHYMFITDDTPISTISLLSPSNDSIVEGGENIEIQFSEVPHFEYYSWDGLDNITELTEIPVSSDTHVLRVFVADSALNWKTTKYIFYTKIQISLDSHMNNSIINPFDSIDFTFGENPDVYQYGIDDNSPIILTDNNKTLNITLPSVSKTYSLTIRVNDSLNGRWNNETYIFVVLIYVNITSHNNGGFAETGDPLDVYFSDTPITKLFSWDNNRNSSRNPVVPSPDGYHTFDIYVGNIEGQFWHYHYEFTVDTDLIDILLISPTNNTIINSWENFTIDFSEDPFDIEFQWDNLTISNNLTSVPNIEGGHYLNVSVYDEAGNQNSKVFYWIIDDSPINITIMDLLQNNALYSGDFLNISFDQDPVIEWYDWDNEASSPALPPNPHGNGTHNLNISVYDGLNWNVVVFGLNITDLPPHILINGFNNSIMSGSLLEYNLSKDVNEFWYQWDDGSQLTSTNIIIPLLPDGIHNLTLTAKDLGGSQTVKTFEIQIDNTPIKIETINPNNNSLINGIENISIVFDEVPYSVSYSWAHLGVSRFDEIPPTPQSKGVQLILNVRAYDEAGNLLNTNIYYKIPTDVEQVSPFIFATGFSVLIIGVIGYVKRSALKGLFGKIKDKLPAAPRRIE